MIMKLQFPFFVQLIKKLILSQITHEIFNPQEHQLTKFGVRLTQDQIVMEHVSFWFLYVNHT
jgi:hypothetical protein